MVIFVIFVGLVVVVPVALLALSDSGKRDVLRAFWHGARDHRVAALLLLAWYFAVLAAWVGGLIDYHAPGSIDLPGDQPRISFSSYSRWPFPPDWLDPQDLYSPWPTNEVFFLASVPFLTAIFTAWWRSTSPGSVSRLASWHRTGVIVGMASLAALHLGLVGLVVLVSLGLGYPPVFGFLGFESTVMNGAVAVVCVGTLFGLLGGLVGNLAASLRRGTRGGMGTRRPA